MNKGPLYRCWAEISLSTLRRNYETYLKELPSGQRIMAVVKADGYGHGDVQTAQCLQEAGADLFAVSNLSEAMGLRGHGIRGEILILGYTPCECAPLLLEHDITQTLLDEAHAEGFFRQGLPIKAQYAVDTGMNRIGLDGDDPARCERAIRAAAEKLRLNGIFTHLCVADTPSEAPFTEAQLEKFRAVASRVADLALPYVHCRNTAGGLFYNDGRPESPVGMVRLGISLYGLKPDYANTLPEGIEPALTWKTVITMVKPVHPGETVGYGRTYTAESERRVATLCVGYADGYRRELSNTGTVLLYGRRAPVIGRVCMDQITVDVTDIPEAKPGDEVILLGKSGTEVYTADDMAHTIGTIGYEIVCGISKRVPRFYTE